LSHQSGSCEPRVEHDLDRTRNAVIVGAGTSALAD
jgi:hypothetical protein